MTAGDRSPGQIALLAMLVVVPAGHAVVFVVRGAVATIADLAIAVAVLVAGSAFVLGSGRTGRPRALPAVDLPCLLLAGFGLYAVASGLWSDDPGYALVKGAGYVGLTAAAWLLARSGTSWERAADAWLVGTAIALAVTGLGLAALALAPAVAGSPGGGWVAVLGEQVVHRGGSVQGIGIPRLRGPFFHPNLFGEYLLVSGALLWGRWHGLDDPRPVAVVALAIGIGVAMALAVPSAWVGIGPLIAAWGWWSLTRTGGGAPAGDVSQALSSPRSRSRVVPLGALLFGTTLTAFCVAGLLFPLTMTLGPIALTTDGMRPRIWASALEHLAEAPVLGMGAEPFVAQVRAGVLGGGPVGDLWDAHSLYLSVLGQFGILGSLLLAGGVALLLRGARASGHVRARFATLAALVGIGLHGFFSGSEDFRHVWFLLGLAGLLAAENRREETDT